MSIRELLVLGTASAVPTRRRNHNGYLLRWDGHGILFDPGEGTQRQLIHAGGAANDITWICITHFHGDHCLGVPGMVQRIARDNLRHPVHAAFPASGTAYWERLRHATSFYDVADIRERPVSGDQYDLTVADQPFELTARRLDHPLEAYGYRLAEPDGLRMLPEALRERGVRGPMVRQLQEDGQVTNSQGQLVRLEECSVPRPGQKVAFVMDTKLCDAAFALAEGVDLLVIESTFLDEEIDQAAERGHLTAGQAARVAAESGVGHLLLTHFSERYRDEDDSRFLAEAGAVFDGSITVAHDLDRVSLPPRRSTPSVSES